MGAWGHLFDENDDAADWLAEFSDSPSWSTVDTTLSIDQNDYIEAPDASQALAAAEVVAAGLGRSSPRLDPAIASWAVERGAEADTRRDRAASVLRRVRDDSELSELWQEAAEYSDWRQSVEETISRLG